jgi:hypothetical protein
MILSWGGAGVYDRHMKHRRLRSRLRVAIELVPRSDEFVPAAAALFQCGHSRWMMADERVWKIVRSAAPGFVPAANAVVPQIAHFLEI